MRHFTFKISLPLGLRGGIEKSCDFQP